MSIESSQSSKLAISYYPELSSHVKLQENRAEPQEQKNAPGEVRPLPKTQGVQHLLVQQQLYLKLLSNDYEKAGCSSNFFEESSFYKTMMVRFIHGLCTTTRLPKIPEDQIMQWCSSSEEKGEVLDLTFEKILHEIRGANGISPRSLLKFCDDALQAANGDNFKTLRRCLIAYPFCIFSSLKDILQRDQVSKQLKDNQIPDIQQTIYCHQLRQFFAPGALHKRIGWELVARNSNPEELDKKYSKVHARFTPDFTLDFYDLTESDDHHFIVHATALWKAAWLAKTISKSPQSWMSCSLLNCRTSYYNQHNSRPFPVALILEADPRSIVLTAEGDLSSPSERDLYKAGYAIEAMRQTTWQDYHCECIESQKREGHLEVKENSMNKNSILNSSRPFLGITELINKTNPGSFNEIIILGSLAEKELSTRCKVKGIIFRLSSLYDLRELVQQDDSSVINPLREIQNSKLPLFLVDGCANPQECFLISERYRALKEKLESLKNSLEPALDRDAINKKIDFCNEEIYEFEDECIERKPSPKLWLANDQLKMVYRHFAALKKLAKTPERKFELDQLMASAKKIDKQLRGFKVAHHELHTEISESHFQGIEAIFAAPGQRYMKKALEFYQTGMAMKN